jgi:4-hydroxy-tetrahydrodipicolinate synthase
VVPYYNKPSQEGIYQHFKAIAEAVDLPMVLYNVPGRTVADMLHDTALRLAQLPGVVGIKEATGNIERAWLIKHAPKGFADLLRRRRHRRGADAAGRPGQRQRHGQRGTAADARAVHGGHRRATRDAAALQMRLLPLHKQPVLRAQPGARQVGDAAAGPVGGGCACRCSRR